MAALPLTLLSFSPSSSQSSLRASADASSSLRSSSFPNSFLANKLSGRPPNAIHLSSIPRAAIAAALPTKREIVSTDEVPKWSARAIKSFAMAHLQARKIKYQETGTESLLAGILVEGANVAATFLRANGITTVQVINETVNLLGKAEMLSYTAICPPHTEQAQRALDWAVDEKIKSGKSGEVTTVHLLLGIWAQEDSAGHKILSTLGFNDEKAKEIAKSIDHDNVYNTSLLLLK